MFVELPHQFYALCFELVASTPSIKDDSLGVAVDLVHHGNLLGGLPTCLVNAHLIDSGHLAGDLGRIT
jgi:hypothetical protein